VSVPDNPQPATFVFSGGGTGGHLFPGIAVAQELQVRERNCRILFVGSERDVEGSVVARYGYEHRALPVQPLSSLRRNPLSFVLRNVQALRQASRLLREHRPAAVVGLGGWVSVPIAWAATRRKIPVVLLEQNTIPGRATRWLGRRASRVCLSFPESARHLSSEAQTVHTGNPVRRAIADLHCATTSDNEHSPPTLLILGGSQGASILNEMLPTVVERLRPAFAGWRIVHQTGRQERELVGRRYAALNVDHVVESLLEDMADWYRRATVVVSRAGATTLAELACAGCPAILVPYPFAADDHQAGNARVFAAAGAAFVVEQSKETAVTEAALTETLARLLSDAHLRTEMRQAMWDLAVPDAAARVVEVLTSL
jgi:UDP-N-acetylglucosamine--N-acetylmuramyl-(pentapeptide) pyrophosphoryl-undecaprenol N-acetylglucosamine transferase